MNSKYTSFIILFLCINSIFSQIDINALKSFVSIPPTEKNISVPFKMQVTNQKKVIKYFVKIEDPNNILKKIGSSIINLKSELNIYGNKKVKNLSEADIIYKCIIQNYSTFNQEIYDTGSTLFTGGINQKLYKGKALFSFNICSQLITNSKTDNLCKSINYSDIEITTKRNVSKTDIANYMNSNRFLKEFGEQLTAKIRIDFSNKTGTYQHYSSNLDTSLPFAVFYQKDSKKHKKGTNDKNVKALVQDFIKKEDDFNKSLKLELFIKKINGVTETKNNSEEIKSFTLFWKNELIKKYKTRNKKSNIRVAMALNLFSSSLIIKDFENVEYAFKILKEENYGSKEHNKTNYKKLNQIILGMKPIDYYY